MLSDQELIDGLRSGLATLHPRSDLIERLRERAGAGQPRALPSRSPHRPRWLPTFSAVVAMASVLIALAVGGGALVLLSGHHPPRLRTTASPLASPTHSSNGSPGELSSTGAAAPADELPRNKLQAALAELPDADRETTLFLAAREGLMLKR